ncbi:hypothetical protein RJ639_030882 [Escallonia herrerae]|uniref:Uncharacterized protein n=1 Tax=Escallonia herrerae TaxID=1293975 RepID=A0AA89BHQ5_9ASTE|nr:hypothetical protein RJ639_030882 [Escallonia herrerae]
MATDRAFGPWSWMSATRLWAAMVTTVTSLRALATSWTPLSLSGMLWECQKVTGVNSMYFGLILDYSNGITVGYELHEYQLQLRGKPRIRDFRQKYYSCTEVA